MGSLVGVPNSFSGIAFSRNAISGCATARSATEQQRHRRVSFPEQPVRGPFITGTHRRLLAHQNALVSGCIASENGTGECRPRSTIQCSVSARSAMGYHGRRVRSRQHGRFNTLTGITLGNGSWSRIPSPGPTGTNGIATGKNSLATHCSAGPTSRRWHPGRPEAASSPARCPAMVTQVFCSLPTWR